MVQCRLLSPTYPTALSVYQKETWLAGSFSVSAFMTSGFCVIASSCYHRSLYEAIDIRFLSSSFKVKFHLEHVPHAYLFHVVNNKLIVQK